MRLLLIATMLLASASGFAKSPMAVPSSSESSYFFWQAESGKHFLLPELEYTKLSIDTVPPGTLDWKSTLVHLGYEYGWDDSMSFGAIVTYAKDSFSTATGSTTNSGLEDLKLYAKGTYALSPGNLKYGAVLNVSPGKQKVETNNDKNEYTGRHSLTPYIGYEQKVSSWILGAKLSYELALTKEQSEAANGVVTKTGGDTDTVLALFGESACSFGRWGASLTHTMTSKSKPDGAAESSNPTANELAIYGDHNLNEATALTAKISYIKVGSADGIDSGSGFHLALGARFNF